MKELLQWFSSWMRVSAPSTLQCQRTASKIPVSLPHADARFVTVFLDPGASQQGGFLASEKRTAGMRSFPCFCQGLHSTKAIFRPWRLEGVGIARTPRSSRWHCDQPRVIELQIYLFPQTALASDGCHPALYPPSWRKQGVIIGKSPGMQ
jgi:hypothetical protein